MHTRRHFIRTASAAAVLSPALVRGSTDSLGQILPQREFGSTGEKVTAIGLGGFHVGLGQNEKKAQALIEHAIGTGIRFFDNAIHYQNGVSETYYGKFLTPKYRDQVFLTTKTLAKNSTDAKADFEASLRRLNTDHVDFWQIHAVDSIEDVEERIKNGVLDVFLEMREKKRARYIGFSGHTNQKAHCHLIDFCTQRGIKIDGCLMPVNLVDPNYDSFIINVLPRLIENGIALLAMKTMVFGRIFEHIDKVAPGIIVPKNLHEFVYSLPTSCLISGCETIAQIDENTAILKNYQPMKEVRRKELSDAVVNISGKALEYYKKPLKNS